MKTLLRTLGLTFGLSLTLFSIGHTQTLGTCKSRCVPGFTVVTWQATYQDCCSGDYNPGCPAGTTAIPLSFQPAGGATGRCAL